MDNEQDLILASPHVPDPGLRSDMSGAPGSYLSGKKARSYPAFIHHPTQIPLIVQELYAPNLMMEKDNISQIRLCFEWNGRFTMGAILRVNIPVREKYYCLLGMVVSVRPVGENYEIGLQLGGRRDAFEARMVEQICHIEAYRQEVYANEKRQLSTERAAQEWIAKYAPYFPVL